MPSELLNMTLPNKAKAIYSNCIQMISQYNKKRMDIESSAISFLYHPYEPLSSEKVEEILHVMEMLLAEEKYNSLISLCEDIMHLSLNGLSYYHNYYQKPLLITISLSFMGWIMFLLKVLLKQRINTQAEYSIASKGLLRPNGGVDIVIRTISILMAILAFYLIYGNATCFLKNLLSTYNTIINNFFLSSKLTNAVLYLLFDANSYVDVCCDTSQIMDGYFKIY